MLIGTFCAALSSPGTAARHSDATGISETLPPVNKRAATEVMTSDAGFATPEMLKLDPQEVMSQGGSLRPGPHNRHFRPPHGGPVTAGDRSDVPGRE